MLQPSCLREITLSNDDWGSLDRLLLHISIFENCYIARTYIFNQMFGHKDEEQIACQGCGKLFPKSKLKKCKSCGYVFCRKCQRKHHCFATYHHETKVSVESDYQILTYERDTGQTIIGNGGHHNPQCIIKMSDMRIYDIARNPEWMTEEEKSLLAADPDIRRRYEHYRTIILTKGY